MDNDIFKNRKLYEFEIQKEIDTNNLKKLNQGKKKEYIKIQELEEKFLNFEKKIDNLMSSFITLITTLFSIGIGFVIIYGFSTELISSFMSLSGITPFEIVLLFLSCSIIVLIILISMIYFVYACLNYYIFNGKEKIKCDLKKNYLWRKYLYIIAILFGLIILSIIILVNLNSFNK